MFSIVLTSAAKEGVEGENYLARGKKDIFFDDYCLLNLVWDNAPTGPPIGLLQAVDPYFLSFVGFILFLVYCCKKPRLYLVLIYQKIVFVSSFSGFG